MNKRINVSVSNEQPKKQQNVIQTTPPHTHIVAKVVHDKYITELCTQHPFLDERYGTKKHLKRSFACCQDKPVAQLEDA